MLTQPEFPAHRRRDPLRLAELQAYTEFMNSDRAGRALYELKTSRNVPELDFAILLEDVAGGVDDGFTGCKVIKNHRDRALVLTALDTGLRHTFTTWHIRRGGKVAVLKEILGHDKIETTMLYVTLAGVDVSADHAKYSPVGQLGLIPESR